jgi:hypothetical protein
MLDFIIGCKLDEKYLILFKNKGDRHIIFNYYHGELQVVKKLKSYREVVDTYYHYIQNGFIEMTSSELTQFYPEEFNINTTITSISGIEVEQTYRCSMQ